MLVYFRSKSTFAVKCYNRAPRAICRPQFSQGETTPNLGQGCYAEIAFRTTKSEIRNPDGSSVVFAGLSGLAAGVTDGRGDLEAMSLPIGGLTSDSEVFVSTGPGPVERVFIAKSAIGTVRTCEHPPWQGGAICAALGARPVAMNILQM
jgi:hypothetical protein